MPMICSIRHIHCETLGTIADALEQEGVGVEEIRTFEGQPVPRSMEPYDGLIVMGGPMAVYEQDRYDHLRHEIHLIEQALHRAKPILGVCLGSQLLAAALGAAVTKGPHREIGWFPVTLTDAAAQTQLWADARRRFTAMHWHGDIFGLPKGAVSLASSDLTVQQAFR
jgi:GMP synthase (glutamine-hydrolysing)